MPIDIESPGSYSARLAAALKGVMLPLVKADVGLNNVDNTSDLNKPLSLATQTALSLRVSKSANLSDLTNVSVARTNLQLGTAATQNVEAFATAAQGLLASTSLQPNAAISSIAGLQAELNSKATTTQGAKADTALQPGTAQSNISGLVTALAGKATVEQGAKADTALQPGTAMDNIGGLVGALGGKAPLSHTHEIVDIVNLQAELDGKATTAQGAKADTALQPGTAISNVSGLQAALDGKATTAQGAKADTALQPGTAISNVSGLQAALDGKATTAQGAKADTALQPGTAQSNISGLVTALAGKATTAQGAKADTALQPGTAISNVSGLQAALDGKQASLGFTAENAANKGANNGYAPLGADAKVPAAYLPTNGSYAGTWNASTNSPTITSGVGTNGSFYYVSTAGSTNIDGTSSWATGDQIIFNGTIWQKIPSSAAVQSVAGKTGAVTLVKADVGLSNVDNTSDANKPVSSATQTALNGKANTTHTHAIADTTGLQAALDGKAGSSHTHTIANVTNLQTTLDGKATSAQGALADTALQPGTAQSNISGLVTALAGKAATVHSHIIADTTGLQAALDGKQASLGFTAENAANKNIASGYAGLNAHVKLLPALEYLRNTVGVGISVVQAWRGYTELNTLTKNSYTATNVDGNMRLTATSNDSTLYITGLTVVGSSIRYVAVRYKLVSGTQDLNIYWSNAGHSFNSSYKATLPLQTTTDGYITSVIDMWEPAAGGTDWKDNTNTAVRFDFVNTNGDVIEISWIALCADTVPYGIAEMNARYATATHVHSGADITTGTVADARLPTTLTAKTFSGNVTISSSDPAVILAETDTTTNARFIVSTGMLYIQAAANGSGSGTSSGAILVSGYNGADIGTFQVRYAGASHNVWHAGNDGAGSGLDADLLDGQQGSYYLSIANATGTIAEATLPTRLQAASQAVSDWNLAINAGFYNCDNTATNGPPVAGYYIGFVSTRTTTAHTVQDLYDINSTASDTKHYRRIRNSGTWGSWYRVRDAETELDARYLGLTATAANSTQLNGQAASYYTNAANLTGTIADARLPTRLGVYCKTITNWNTAVENGWYMGSSATNTPVAGWCFGTVTAHNSLYITQDVCQFSSDGSSDTKTYRREMNNGTWGSWYRLRMSEAELDARYLGLTATAANSTQLGGVAASNYLQVNTAISNISGLQTALDARESLVVLQQVTANSPTSHNYDIRCNTASSAITITLPASPAANTKTWISRAGANIVTIARNGQTIEGLAEDFILDTDKRGVLARFVGGTWRLEGRILA